MPSTRRNLVAFDLPIGVVLTRPVAAERLIFRVLLIETVYQIFVNLDISSTTNDLCPLTTISSSFDPQRSTVDSISYQPTY